jgi:hypothetical protein
MHVAAFANSIDGGIDDAGRGTFCELVASVCSMSAAISGTAAGFYLFDLLCASGKPCWHLVAIQRTMPPLKVISIPSSAWVQLAGMQKWRGVWSARWCCCCCCCYIA